MNAHAATLVATSAAGFFVGGSEGAAAAVVAWAAVLIGCWRLRTRNALSLPGLAGRLQPSAYADIEYVIDRLDDHARERNWSPGKRFDIARMACENRTMTIDELEHRYDMRHRLVPDSIQLDASEGPKNDESA